MKLMKMTDFVIEYYSDETKDEFQALNLMKNYAHFLKQPLKLEMFVPCDGDGNVLEEPLGYKYWIKDDENGAYEGEDVPKCIEFQKAKEKVLFEFDGGITLLKNSQYFFIIEDKNGKWFRIMKNKTELNVEHLFNFSVDIKLTLNAEQNLEL